MKRRGWRTFGRAFVRGALSGTVVGAVVATVIGVPLLLPAPALFGMALVIGTMVGVVLGAIAGAAVGVVLGARIGPVTDLDRFLAGVTAAAAVLGPCLLVGDPPNLLTAFGLLLAVVAGLVAGVSAEAIVTGRVDAAALEPTR